MKKKLIDIGVELLGLLMWTLAIMYIIWTIFYADFSGLGRYGF